MLIPNTAISLRLPLALALENLKIMEIMEKSQISTNLEGT